MKILEPWVNKIDSEHERGKWVSPDRLSEFCDMVKHIHDVYGRYEEIAAKRAEQLREKYDL